MSFVYWLAVRYMYHDPVRCVYTDIHVGGVSRDGVKTSTLRYIFICN